MPHVERQRSTKASQMDVLDRVLDRGIVIDAWLRLSVSGIDLITVNSRIVVASLETYERYAGPIRRSVSAARPSPQESSPSAAPPSTGFARRLPTLVFG